MKLTASTARERMDPDWLGLFAIAWSWPLSQRGQAGRPIDEITKWRRQPGFGPAW